MPEGALPSWWGDRADKKRQNDRSRAQERRVAREVGGRTVAGSGSSWRAPGDIKAEDYLVEHKGTNKASFRLTLEDWEQAASDALRSGREPAMIIEFASTGRRLLVTEYTEP